MNGDSSVEQYSMHTVLEKHRVTLEGHGKKQTSLVLRKFSLKRYFSIPMRYNIFNHLACSIFQVKSMERFSTEVHTDEHQQK